MDEIDIPEAIREESRPKQANFVLSLPLILGVITCLGLVGLLSMFLISLGNKSTPTAVNQPVTKPASPTLKGKNNQQQPTPAAQNISPKNKQTSLQNSSKTGTTAKSSQETLLGHLPYDVAPESELVPITVDDRLKLRPAAAKKFQQMQAAAKADGVNLAAISAFRSTKDQEKLFFKVKEQKAQNATTRAEVSAPPGYSEHHTGYALDIGDANAPATNVEETFANTAAFRWLKQNALKYSFELSFPPNNPQGVNYEPWHWRFVGDRDSLETFYKARN
ncbi:M15 family metallopeptidase [Pleurocapsa sp. FMAR1]|uniref:M15 family metallopeptidase n=1 Tax=Pleurocapsa sp. FMAR1 TaxID=3040204 RepID=UPI0029C66021|nr:D-alanyl-D-alanine carboxypeptidase family protein [Pleurocapsa sp. FMAR1]